MDSHPIPQKTVVQPDVQPPIVSAASSVHKAHYTIYIAAFIFVAVAEAVISYFLFIRKPLQKSSDTLTAPTTAPLSSPNPNPILCSDPPCLMPQFLACAASKLTMPFTEGNLFVVTVYGKENGFCRYGLAVLDPKGNQLNSSECRVPLEKVTKDMLGHLFGEDKSPGKETTKAEQDKLETDYCVNQQLTSTQSAVPSPQASPTPKKVICESNDQQCVFTNIIDNFTNGCKPIEVTTTADSAQVTLTVSPSANGACRLQMNGPGLNQNCLFAKENVTTLVIKGMLGMDNIPKDPAFIQIKAASCK